eukprot:TRINITY_DN8713_c0_g2_i1.p1 TRINITY_DN8713_c0_g2~~TRINITY_DN8713_c0_g2_i1.p1  ORF type:complete len:287 (+),score=13.18 TRINITY_DN8713_c0_g2_i1:78-938(+)
MRFWFNEMIGTAIPIVYMCMLPKLCELAPHGQEPYASKLSDDTVPTLSAYLETPQATGAMGMSFMWPLMYMRLDEEIAEKHLRRAPRWKLVASYVTMTMFFFAFGVLLAFPQSYIIWMNYGSVVIMGVSGTAHFAILLSLSVHYVNRFGRMLMWTILIVGIVSMTCVVVFAYILIAPWRCGCSASCKPVSSELLCGETSRYCIFVSQVVGLSALCLMTFVSRWAIFTSARDARSAAASLAARGSLLRESQVRLTQTEVVRESQGGLSQPEVIRPSQVRFVIPEDVH